MNVCVCVCVCSQLLFWDVIPALGIELNYALWEHVNTIALCIHIIPSLKWTLNTTVPFNHIIGFCGARRVVS